MIDVKEIQVGDVVIIQDKSGNVISGTAQGDHEKTFVLAFGIPITFAAVSRMGNWRVNPDVKIVGHTPQLFPTDAA